MRLGKLPEVMASLQRESAERDAHAPHQEARQPAAI
jgi:hypothetical protein